MSLHLCLDCATIWDCPLGVPLICRKCEQPLAMHDEEEFNKEPSWIVLVSRAAHGPAPRVRRRWEVG